MLLVSLNQLTSHEVSVKKLLQDACSTHWLIGLVLNHLLPTSSFNEQILEYWVWIELDKTIENTEIFHWTFECLQYLYVVSLDVAEWHHISLHTYDSLSAQIPH